MFISRKEYENLSRKAELKDELEKEAHRLEGIINSYNKNCKCGSWCRECQHCGSDQSVHYEYVCGDSLFDGISYIDEVAGVVYYCKKSLRDRCPDFILKEKERNPLKEV